MEALGGHTRAEPSEEGKTTSGRHTNVRDEAEMIPGLQTISIGVLARTFGVLTHRLTMVLRNSLENASTTSS